MAVIISIGFSCDFSHWSMCTRLTFLAENQFMNWFSVFSCAHSRGANLTQKVWAHSSPSSLPSLLHHFFPSSPALPCPSPFLTSPSLPFLFPFAPRQLGSDVSSPAEMTMGHTFWPVTHVTHQSIDPWPAWPVTRDPRLLTSHDSRLLQFSLQWANGPTVPITYMRYRRTFMSLSEQQHMKLKASMEQQWNKSYKTHEAQSDLSKTIFGLKLDIWAVGG